MAGLDAFSQQERQQAWERYQALRPCLDAGVPATAVAREHGLSARTVERWVARYRRDGLAGLVRAPRVDRGQRHFPSDLIGLIEGLALRKPPPTAAAVYRQVVGVAEREGWPPPSYSTVYAVIRHLDPALITLAHEGTTAYRLAFDLLHRREATGPNDLWQADHTPLDLWVRDERGAPVRPWLTVILDDYSRAVAAYRLSLSVPHRTDHRPGAAGCDRAQERSALACLRHPADLLH
jgi:putative transposase